VDRNPHGGHADGSANDSPLGALSGGDGVGRTGRHDFEHAFDVLELPLVLINLADFTIYAASPVLFTQFALRETDVVGRPVADLFYPADAAAALAALMAVRDGIVDFYRGERQMGFTFSTEKPITAWVRSVMIGDQHLALAEFSFGSAESPLTAHFGREPRVMALGTADKGWVIASVSQEICDLLGHPPEELVGESLLGLVPVEDVEGLLEADRVVTGQASVARSVRMRDGHGQWQSLCIVLTELTPSMNRSFMLLPQPSGSSPVSARVADLERHLWRIAGEVEASGVVRQMSQGPALPTRSELGSLTSRQWEVVSRLLQGERVPAIAAEMFISQSTVRNHLSAIFERFGVHSQAELLKVLRNPAP
jgi:DNA-binding CsgD family transcriptional regulator/PAS domain-containing protein